MANHPDDSDPVGADTTADDTLPPSEALDSDELRNADGDEDVTAPEHWQPVDDLESLDDKLAAEEPDLDSTRHHGQVSGSPENGDSFFPED